MRRENLLDGGHNKGIWKRSRDRRRDKVSRQRNSETWWRRTTATLLRVSFGSYKRTCRDVRDVLHMYHWDVLVKYHWDVVGDVVNVSFETYLRRCGDVLMGRCHYIPLKRRYEMPIRRREEVPLTRLGDFPLRRGWVFLLRRTRDVARTSYCRVRKV